jgi:hypothetical protein
MSEEEKIRIPGREGETPRELTSEEAFDVVEAEPKKQQMARTAREMRISEEDLTRLLSEFDKRIVFYERQRKSPEDIVREAKLALQREKMTPEMEKKIQEAIDKFNDKWKMLDRREQLHHRIEQVAAARENMIYFETWKDPRWKELQKWIDDHDLQPGEMKEFLSLCDKVDMERQKLRQKAAENEEIRAMRKILSDMDRKREHYKEYLHTWSYQAAHHVIDELFDNARTADTVDKMIEYEELADFALRELEMREKMKVVHLVIDDSRSSEDVVGLAHRFSADDLNALFDLPGFSEGFSMFESEADKYVYATGPERYKIEEQMARDIELKVLAKYCRDEHKGEATGVDGKTIVRMVFDFAKLSGRLTRYDRFAGQVGDLPMDWLRRLYHTKEWMLRYKSRAHLPAELFNAITCGINDFFSWSWRPGSRDEGYKELGIKPNHLMDYISGEGKFGMNFSLVKMLNYRKLVDEFKKQGLSDEQIERKMGEEEIKYEEIGLLKDDPKKGKYEFRDWKRKHGIREGFEWIKGIKRESKVEDLPERYRDGDKLKPTFFGFDPEWKGYERFTRPIETLSGWGLEHHDFNLTGKDVFQRFWRDTDGAYREVLPVVINFANNPTVENFFKIGNYNIWRTFSESQDIYARYADALMGYLNDPMKLGPIARDQIPFLGGILDRINIGPIKVSGGWRDSRRAQWTAKEDWLFLMNCMEHRRISPEQFEKLVAERIGGKFFGKLPLGKIKMILGEATAKLDAFMEGDFTTTIIYALLAILIKKLAEEEE